MALKIEKWKGFGIIRAGTRLDGTDMVHILWKPKLETPADLHPVALARSFEEARRLIDVDGKTWRKELRVKIKARKLLERAFLLDPDLRERLL